MVIASANIEGVHGLPFDCNGVVMQLHNVVKADLSLIIKRGSLYDNILSAVANLLSATKTTEDSNDSILQAIYPLSSDTLKGAFINMGGKISDLTNLMKKTFALDIERRWGKDIIKEEARKIA